MREFAIDEGTRCGIIEVRFRDNSLELDELNAGERARQGRGFSRGGTMRAVSNIDPDFLNALVLNGDRDATEFAVSGFRDLKSLKRLCSRFPQLRSSEGSI
jgi:hypothetical protein